MRMSATRWLAMLLFVLVTGHVVTRAQWLNYPTPGIPRLASGAPDLKAPAPRTPDGKPNLTAPAPKTPDGKPDITGLWRPGPGYVGNIAKDMKPEDIPYQSWAKTLYDRRRETNSKDDPTASCIVGGKLIVAGSDGTIHRVAIPPRR